MTYKNFRKFLKKYFPEITMVREIKELYSMFNIYGDEHVTVEMIIIKIQGMEGRLHKMGKKT